MSEVYSEFFSFNQLCSQFHVAGKNIPRNKMLHANKTDMPFTKTTCQLEFSTSNVDFLIYVMQPDFQNINYE